PMPTLFPYTTLFRSVDRNRTLKGIFISLFFYIYKNIMSHSTPPSQTTLDEERAQWKKKLMVKNPEVHALRQRVVPLQRAMAVATDRKSTRLNPSHVK